MLRRLRGRFGISAPKVAVRTHVPWHLRIISVVGIVLLTGALLGWAYDAGRRIAGQGHGDAEVVNELRMTNGALEEEVARLRSLLATSESSLQIEQSAQKLLSEKGNTLASENARLREDLAVFERLAKMDAKSADGEVSLDRLSVRTDAVPGRYHYSFLIALQGERRGKDSRFDLQLAISPRTGTAGAKMMYPRREEPDKTQYAITLRNFRRIEGKFEVPAGYVVGNVEVNIFEAGALKASKSLAL